MWRTVLAPSPDAVGIVNGRSGSEEEEYPLSAGKINYGPLPFSPYKWFSSASFTLM